MLKGGQSRSLLAASRSSPNGCPAGSGSQRWSRANVRASMALYSHTFKTNALQLQEQNHINEQRRDNVRVRGSGQFEVLADAGARLSAATRQVSP